MASKQKIDSFDIPRSVFIRLCSWLLADTNDGETKGRELVAPFVEAPRSALVMNAPSRADWRALGLDHHSENSRFSTKTGPCYAKLCFGNFVGRDFILDPGGFLSRQ